MSNENSKAARDRASLLPLLLFIDCQPGGNAIRWFSPGFRENLRARCYRRGFFHFCFVRQWGTRTRKANCEKCAIESRVKSTLYRVWYSSLIPSPTQIESLRTFKSYGLLSA